MNIRKHPATKQKNAMRQNAMHAVGAFEPLQIQGLYANDLQITYIFLIIETFQVNVHFAKLLSLREFRRPILSDLVAWLVFVCMLVCLLFAFLIDLISGGRVFDQFAPRAPRFL